MVTTTDSPHATARELFNRLVADARDAVSAALKSGNPIPTDAREPAGGQLADGPGAMVPTKNSSRPPVLNEVVGQILDVEAVWAPVRVVG